MLKYLFILFICLISVTVYSKNLDTSVPADLMYNGKPIDSLCFSMDKNLDIIQLNNCGIKKEKYSINGLDQDLIKKGFIGYNWKDTSVSYPAEGSSYYKIFPAENHQYWIYSSNNTGGSGNFTNVSLVKRIHPDKLEIKIITGGDRCNGGISEARPHGKQLEFDVNLTSFDLLILTNENPHQLKAYDDLAACAICCSATATYRVSAELMPKLMYVTLDISDPEAMPAQGKYQVCFNKILLQYIKSGETKLDGAKLKKLGMDFNEKCLGKS